MTRQQFPLLERSGIEKVGERLKKNQKGEAAELDPLANMRYIPGGFEEHRHWQRREHEVGHFREKEYGRRKRSKIIVRANTEDAKWVSSALVTRVWRDTRDSRYKAQDMGVGQE